MVYNGYCKGKKVNGIFGESKDPFHPSDNNKGFDLDYYSKKKPKGKHPFGELFD